MKLRAQGVTWTDVDGEIIALDENAAVYVAANEAGALLWRGLVDGATRESLASLLVDRYGISRQRAETDADAFVASLRERALIEA
jgi:hypothetical protein